MAHTFSPKKQTNENEKNNNSNSDKYNNDNNNNNINNILIKIYNIYITLKPKKIKKVYASALKRPSTIQEYGDYLLGWRLDKL